MKKILYIFIGTLSALTCPAWSMQQHGNNKRSHQTAFGSTNTTQQENVSSNTPNTPYVHPHQDTGVQKELDDLMEYMRSTTTQTVSAPALQMHNQFPAPAEPLQENAQHTYYPQQPGAPRVLGAYNALLASPYVYQPPTPGYQGMYNELQNLVTTPRNNTSYNTSVPHQLPAAYSTQYLRPQFINYQTNTHTTVAPTTTTSTASQTSSKRARTVEAQPIKFLPDPHTSMLPTGLITRRDSATSEPRACGELTEEKLLDLATENLFPYFKKGISLPTTFVVLLKREKDIGGVRLRNLACIAKQYLPAAQTHALYETLQQCHSEIAPERKKYVPQILNILRPEGIDNSLSGNEIITRQWPCEMVRTLLKQEFMTKDVMKTLITHKNYCPDIWHIVHKVRNSRCVQDLSVAARTTFSAQQKAEIYNYLITHPLEGEEGAESIRYILSTFFEGVTPAGCTPMHTVFSAAVLPVKACLVGVPDTPENKQLRLRLGEKIFCHGSRDEIKQAMDMHIPCPNPLAIIEKRFADKSTQNLKKYAARVGYILQ